ncbi:MAG: bifunctional adenosylcobinamide kinase/adenosylcobinamide-phosphate guanylyltransferase [Blautia sp.]|jgi:adenosylcobinamide kinase/adenosylcobinamide-phosphate guanylyltransferase
MELIIGGAYQGALAYAQELFEELQWVDGRSCSEEELMQAQGVSDFQEYIRRMMEQGISVDDLAGRLYERNPKLIIVTCEVGCGVVPVDAFLRKYREKTGRICTELAGKSSRVHRVVCGIGKVIKDA